MGDNRIFYFINNSPSKGLELTERIEKVKLEVRMINVNTIRRTGREAL